MQADQVIILARKHLGSGNMESSARLCLADAVQLYDAGNLDAAKARALKSLAYSVGVLHPDYSRACHHAYRLPARVNHQGTVLRPGETPAGYSVFGFDTLEQMQAFMAGNGQAAMPCWKRKDIPTAARAE